MKAAVTFLKHEHKPKQEEAKTMPVVINYRSYKWATALMIATPVACSLWYFAGKLIGG